MSVDLIRLRQLIDSITGYPPETVEMTEEFRDSMPISWRQFPEAVAVGDFVIIPRKHFERDYCPHCFRDEPDGQMCHCMNDE